jgi:dihydroorotase
MLIKNCKIVNASNVKDGDILIEDSRVVAVGKGLKSDGEVIDAKRNIVMPGIVDAHVHLRDFKEARKEDFTSSSRAALAGGVTTFLEMPNTSPEINDLKTLKKRIELGEKKSLVDFGIHVGFSNKLNSFKDVELPSVKVYMDRLSEDIENVLNRAFTSPFSLSIHCEDARIINRNEKFAKDTGDFLLHGDIREKEAETSAVEITQRFASKFNKPVHLCHLTLPKSINLKNQYTTCEVTPHHILLTEKDLREHGGIAKTNPPLRSKLDVYGLWKAVKEGKVDIIASDHAPHLLDEKKEDVLNCPSGIPNLDVMLRLMLDLVNRGAIKLPDLVRMMCENPGRIFNVRRKGVIQPGADADILILDMDAESEIDPDDFYSKAKYSPFSGRKTIGDVKTVIQRGEVAYEEGEFFVKPGYGRYLYRQV